MKKGVFVCLIAIALAAAAGLRFSKLGLRPMHHDEANQAVKFGLLLEHGYYHYDPTDHHGPTLYYLTLPVAWARGQMSLSHLDETTLRFVPAFFGTALILILAALAPGLGRGAVCAAALFCALSPAMTYFSRFYIQESMFTCFALGFVLALEAYRFRPSAGWALVVGGCAGAAFASKETTAIVFAAAIASFLILRRQARLGIRLGRHFRNTCFGMLAAAAIALLLYSSFLSYPAGIADSFRAFREYAMRAFQNGPHAHPWHYYWGILGYSSSGGLVWSEWPILLFAGLGTLYAWRRVDYWPRYIAFYSWTLALAFSLIRLKTPWNVLPFLSGLVLLAGYGAASLLGSLRHRALKGMLILLLGVGFWHLTLQNLRANFLYPADPRNPYVYAQTLPDLLKLNRRVHEVSSLLPEGKNTPVKVVAGPYEQWPLPWYFRDLTGVGYWRKAAEAGPLDSAPIVISSQENSIQAEASLGNRFHSEFYGLRPGVLLTLFVERALWEKYLATLPR